jgi:hypothetical protein
MSTAITSAGELNALQAILIDPAAGTVVVSYVDLPTLAANPPKYGLQLAPEPLVSLIGKRVAQHRLHGGEVLLVGEGEGEAWTFAGIGPHRGRGLILQYERIADAYSDTLFELDQVGSLLTFDGEAPDEDDEEEARGEAA